MAIYPNLPSSAGNPQLVGILSATNIPGTPRPGGAATAPVGGQSFEATIGSLDSVAPTAPPPPGSSDQTTLGAGVSGGGMAVVGGGSGLPTMGAQPAAPAAVVAQPSGAAPVPAPPPAVPVGGALPTAAATSLTAPVVGAGTVAPATVPTVTAVSATISASGFGRANKDAAMSVTVATDATFSFPSFNQSAAANTAPDVAWGAGWTRVESGGMYFMQHTNGTKAIPAVEFRLTPSPASKVSTVKVANGWGKKFPDGSIVVFDRNEGAYRLDPKGVKTKLPLGNHTIGGVKVRVFEATVVRTLEPSGQVTVFDSRGNQMPGSVRSTLAGPAAANAGAAITGGGKAATPGATVAPGTSREQVVSELDRITGATRTLVDQVRSGSYDPAALQALQAQISMLPAGLLQATGAAATMTTGGTAVAGAAGGGGVVAAPVAGVDANGGATELPHGFSGQLTGPVPGELASRQTRFGQLPADVQADIARALGSTQGAAALRADTMVAFGAGGTFTLPMGGMLYKQAVSSVRGAGPGEEIALTVRPARQPGTPAPSGVASATNTTAAAGTGAVSGAGVGAASVGGTPAPGMTAASATTPPAAGTAPGATPGASSLAPAPVPAPVVGGGAAAGGATAIDVITPGTAINGASLAGVEGSFTWSTLPAAARTAILDHLRTPGSAAATAYASRTGSGWTFDPNDIIVVSGGAATFVGGLSIHRAAAAATATGGGALPAAPVAPAAPAAPAPAPVAAAHAPGAPHA